VRASDGSAIGVNHHSLVPRGDSRNYLWEIDRDVGTCLLRDKGSPDHPASGLYGALVVEPPGSKSQPSLVADDAPGCQAIIADGKSAFREFVIFIHDDFNDGQNYVNYLRAAADSPYPPPPKLLAHTGDPVRLRLIHAASVEAQNHSFYVGGRRWPFDPFNVRSNRLAAISLAPGAVFDLHFFADADATEPRTYVYSSLVSDQFNGGEWGLFRVLPRKDPAVRPLP